MSEPRPILGGHRQGPVAPTEEVTWLLHRTRRAREAVGEDRREEAEPELLFVPEIPELRE